MISLKDILLEKLKINKDTAFKVLDDLLEIDEHGYYNMKMELLKKFHLYFKIDAKNEKFAQVLLY